MAICSVVKILESIQNLKFLTRTIKEDIELWRDERDNTFYCVGNNVVVVKVWFRGSLKGMRCYMRECRNLELIYGHKFLARELYIYKSHNSGEWIDVVMEEWVEGSTLKSQIDIAIANYDTARICSLSQSFTNLATELLSADWAHGDLTCENMIVTPQGEVKLIDFDCKFIPQLQNTPSPELGTAAYQPPQRTINDFDRNIDDYSIALIYTALQTLSVEPRLYEQFPFKDGILYSPKLIAKGRCEALERSLEIFISHSMPLAYRIAKLLQLNTLRIPSFTEILTHQTPDTTENLELTMRYNFVGYSTPQGEIIVPHIYDEGLDFRDNVAMVRLNDKWGAIDRSGKVIIKFGEFSTTRTLTNEYRKKR